MAVVILVLLAIVAAAVAFAAGHDSGATGLGSRQEVSGGVDCAKHDGICIGLDRGAPVGGPQTGIVSEALRHRLRGAIAERRAAATGGPTEKAEVAPSGEVAPGSEASHAQAGSPAPEGAPTETESSPPETESTTPEGESGSPEAESLPPTAELPSAPILEPGCPLDGSSSSLVSPMYVLGCDLSASDMAHESDPLPFWGSIDCAQQSRYEYVEQGGDNHLSATGEPLDGAFRRVTVDNGDDVFGERCELGENSTTGPTAFYREGDQVLTYYSERLPSNFPISTDSWQTVMQMKQAQPSHDDGSGVALEMEARQNHWVVAADWNSVWQFPAQAGVWTRFAWDVYYSKDPSKGWLQVSADLNGDGDFDDPGERSPVIHTATLATEIPGYESEDGLPAGAAIPSHLRMGVYHDPSIACPAPNGCSIDIDNVQILRPLP